MNSKFVRKAVAPMEGGRDEIGAERSEVGEENGGGGG
jgi:hypothetical protein